MTNTRSAYRPGHNPPGWAEKTVEDLRKAVWYINRQIQRLESAEK